MESTLFGLLLLGFVAVLAVVGLGLLVRLFLWSSGIELDSPKGDDEEK